MYESSDKSDILSCVIHSDLARLSCFALSAATQISQSPSTSQRQRPYSHAFSVAYTNKSVQRARFYIYYTACAQPPMFLCCTAQLFYRHLTEVQGFLGLSSFSRGIQSPTPPPRPSRSRATIYPDYSDAPIDLVQPQRR